MVSASLATRPIQYVQQVQDGFVEQQLQTQELDQPPSSQNPIYAAQPSLDQSHNQYQESCRPC